MFTGRFFNHTMNLIISNHAHNQFITRVFADVNHAIVEQQILAFNALQSAAYGWGFVQIVRLDFGGVGIHRVEKFARFFLVEDVYGFAKLGIGAKFGADAVNFWGKFGQ